MPHINSIRLANVHFNNATQVYDDFRMELGGKNTTYDLENGGGKSLLLQMILQTVLPKTYLRKEKSISLLFQSGKERTSHVAVDWILDKGSQYKYLLTGFCARKKRGLNASSIKESDGDEENLQAGDIEHLNWCVFHNDNKIAGMRKLPFVSEESGKKIYAGFDEIRKYIQMVKQKGLPAEIFDGIDKYQSYISGQNLITAEWNIIRGINSGENSIESYFRQNTTSRKLIENRFVKIIEDIEALNKSEKSNEQSLLLADTLIEIRGRLNEYLKLKSHMAEFEHIKEYYNEFGKRNEDLYTAIKGYEECKSQASGIRNLITDMLTKLEDEKNKVINKIDDNTASRKEGETLKKQLEAGQVQFGIDRLTSEKGKLEADKEMLTQNKNALDNNYSQAMAYEGYGKYRKIKGRLHEAEQSLMSIENDGDELNRKYRDAAGRYKFLMSKEISKGTSKAEELREILDKLIDLRKTTQNSLIAREKEASTLEALSRPLKNRKKILEDDLKSLQDYFLAHGNLDAVTEPREFLKRIEEETIQHISQFDNISERLQQINTEVQNLDIQATALKGEIKQKEEANKRDDNWLNSYKNELERLNSKAADLGKNSVEEYKDELEIYLHRDSLNKLQLEIERGRLQQKKQLSEDNGYYVPNEEILSLSKQMSKKCEYVQSGIEFIAGLSNSEKDVALKKMSFLPFSIIVDRKSFDKLITGKIKINFSSDYPVPVVNAETIRRKNDPFKEDVFYYCSFSGLILEKTKYEQYIKSIESKLNYLSNEIFSGEIRIKDYNADLIKVLSFLENYPKEKIDDASARVKEINNQIKTIKTKLIKINEKQGNLSSEKDSINDLTNELSKIIKESKENEDRLRDSIAKGDELTKVRQDLSQKQKKLEVANSNIINIKNQAEELELRFGKLRLEQQSLNNRLYELKSESEPLVSFTVITTEAPLFEVQAEYKSLHDAISGKNADESRLRSDIEDFKSSLDEEKNRILRDYGENLEQIEQSEKAGEHIFIPSQESIRKIIEDREDVNIKLESNRKLIGNISEKIAKSEGKLEEILRDMPEDSISEFPQYDSENQYKQEIEFTKQLIKSYEDETETLVFELDSIKRDIGKLSNQVEYFDSFMEREKVSNIVKMSAKIKDFKAFEKEYQGHVDNCRYLSAKWTDRIKVINEETALYIILEPIEELGKIRQPETSSQCLSRRDAFKEYMINIEEQIRKINSDLLQLESYQQSFSLRCIQRAELVLGHLKKLEQLSRIEVFGRRTNMIELKIPEFGEKEKQLRMKTHIDAIVRGIDEEGVVDRKNVAVKLSTKELLAQITDMDKAVVRLYKIESIPENSKFYRWEQAIGSEGQNNSLYFIFAACLISFIRMLSITNTSIKTKKVIIADNPFGATSASYLWDPMFKIMKRNEIQLIAPGHRIPREITSRFGVNYLLNQEILQDGRMRVVVKDIRAEEDEDLLKYIEPEQLSMM